MYLLNKAKPFLYLNTFYLLVSLVVRLVLICNPVTDAHFGFMTIIKMLAVGLLSDVLVFTLLSLPFVLYFIFLSDSKYKKPWGYIIFGVLVLLWCYTAFVPDNIFNQYGGSLETVALIFISIKVVLSGLMLFLPKKRLQIRNTLYFTTLLLYVVLIIFSAVSEYFFWNEFGVRYNFIAVDYLVYTNEVIGNIIESYPVVPLFSGIFLLGVAATWFIYKQTKSSIRNLPNILQKSVLVFCFAMMCGLSFLLSPLLSNVQASNTFEAEIQSNGMNKFYYAFTHNELDFFTFYPTLGVKKANDIYLSDFTPSQLQRTITPTKPELHKNVVLISVESLSAEFLAHYGNTKKITPFLDSLADKSLFFTNLYATGNRTVRGLEALTMCVPPTAGESIIKREDNKHKFTTGSVFASKGYQVKFLYGGYSYFDNMQDFFTGNGYGVVDRNDFTKDEISFANVWGVCDEDMADKAIGVMNAEAAKGAPFFNHWMTVSNHRPFTYPEGKIDIPGNINSRDGGVKYTDYALHKFFTMAEQQPWFANTVFIIVADHCASSAGKTELPMDKYRIPAIVYSQGFIAPQQYAGLMSQADIMPTVFGLLNFNYQSKFLGQDALDTHYVPRAFMATYQSLGYVRNNYLTVISPGKKIEQYQLVQQQKNAAPVLNIYYDERAVAHLSQPVADTCIAAYESVSHWLKNGDLDRR